MMGTYYGQMRTYRRRSMATPTGKALLELMERRFERPFENYWQQFGYEIGGPVCWAYTKWVAGEIEKRPMITDIAFVARDGWLLKQIYDLLPHGTSAKSHYVYAPRTLTLLCEDEKNRERYRDYLRALPLGDGTVAVVDTVTMKFSSQRVISKAVENEVLGFFWVILANIQNYGAGFQYLSYQKQRHHTIRCWNLMEFIMTSPEPPIRALEDGRPIYRAPNEFESERETIFSQMEAGVLEFAHDALAIGEDLQIDNLLITQWVNGFLQNPDASDKAAFRGIYVSEREDHSDQTPMVPFARQGLLLSPKELKELLWVASQRHEWLYQFLHRGKRMYLRVSDLLRDISYERFDGTAPEKLAEKLVQYDVVSFDIFDTLLFRRVKKPTDLFTLMEKENGLFDFHDNRIRAEADARRAAGGNGEIGIREICERLAKRYGIDARTLAEREMEAEREICYANEAMVELCRLLEEKGKRMIAVSDMYLPRQFLRELLDGCGYQMIERVFVSGEYGAGKTGGALQRVVSAELGDGLRYVHIGDNQQSDVLGSKAAGWDAVWYRRKD